MIKSYPLVSGALFGVIAGIQALRAINGWPVHIGDFEVPLWASWVASAIAAGLCAWAFKAGCCSSCAK